MTEDNRIDDRVQADGLMYVVFLLDDVLRKIALTREHPSSSAGGLSFAASSGGLRVDGQPVATGVVQVHDRALLVVDMTKVNTHYLVFNRDDDVLVGCERHADLHTRDDTRIIVHGNALLVYAGSRFTYIDSVAVHDHTVMDHCPIGTTVLTPDFQLERRSGQWRLTVFDRHLTINPQAALEQRECNNIPVGFPDYLRSPRVNLEAPADDITVNPSPRQSSKDRNGLLKSVLPPLAMVAASVAMSVFSGRDPLMMLGMGFMSAITAVFTCTQYFADNKETRAHNRELQRQYDAYLLSVVARLQRLHDRERYVLDYRYPSPGRIQRMIRKYDTRIYERMLNSKDFLRISLGRGCLPSHVNVHAKTAAMEDMPSQADSRAEKIAAEFAVQPEAPITVDLNHTTVGLVGSGGVTTAAVSNLLLQIAFFHSYHDVNFVTLVSEADYQRVWHAWRFLPHLKMQRINTRGIVHNVRTRDMVLSSFLQTMKQRRNTLREAGKEQPSFSPHYVLSIMDDSYLAGHGLNEFLAEDMSDLGVSVIWCKEDKGLLPETVDTLVQYMNQGAGRVINDHARYVQTAFTPYAPPERIEPSIRRLSNLHHREVEKNAIPTMVDFLGLYQARTVDDLRAPQRWSRANTAKSLAVPLGLRGKDDIEELNLHERAHGPHGLVAGTTGSGKSEILQSYMLSLAVNFAPEDVGFLPIDFKGGGMANLFQGLPHLMGSITNLDGAATARALASIDAELKKRQRLFGQYNVNSINGYTTLYKRGKTVLADPGLTADERARYPVEPLPHLFLICDEFAELKSNQPEFIDALVSTARIGRSLGVHLILATQKPSGVVTDQIWSNSRFKIALKVADTSDSQEVIKTPDAASISEPGRAYLQVGNNEIYELFQSAWSGAKYVPYAADVKQTDERVYRINELGQYELMTQDLSQDDQSQITVDGHEPPQEPMTQLDAVVAYLARVAKRSDAVIPDKPWLPALADHITAPDRIAPRRAPLPALSAPMGMLDLPWKQQQRPYDFDMNIQSHTVVFGASGYGKTTLVTTLLLGLAQRYTPEELHILLFDFSHNGLLPLQGMPHTADRIGLDESEKLHKALRRIDQTMENRKALLKEQGAVSLDQYEQRTGHGMPRIILVVDGYDALGQDPLRDDVDELLSSVLREGSSMGMYLVITANRVNAIRSSLLANIPTRIALYLNDEYDVQALFGRGRQMQADIPGRAQMLVDGVATLMQCYQPVEGDNDTQMLARLDDEVHRLDAAWTGERPQPIPMVPDRLTIDSFNHRDDVRSMRAHGGIPFGLAYEDAMVRGIDSDSDAPLALIAYADEDQLALWERLVLPVLAASAGDVQIVDYQEQFESAARYGNESPGRFTVHTSADDMQDILMLLSRYEQLAKAQRVGDPVTLVIADLARFAADSGLSANDLTMNARLWRKAGLRLIVCSPHRYIAKSYDPVAKAVRELKWEGMVSSRIYDSALLQAPGTYADPMLAGNEAYYAAKGGQSFTKIRIPE